MLVELASAGSASQLEEAAKRAAQVLAAGGLIIHPTETVYGLGGEPSPEANRLVSWVKQREPTQPLILLTPDLDSLRGELDGLIWTEEAEILARHFWPGPLTLVIPCTGASAGLAGPGGGVAVRVSPNPTVAAILTHWRRPMTSTSANLSGGRPARSVEQALEMLRERPDLDAVDRTLLAIDAGAVHGRLPSTIVTCVERPPRLLREGPVSRQQIQAVMPELQ